jgi:hypothetical protein
MISVEGVRIIEEVMGAFTKNNSVVWVIIHLSRNNSSVGCK